MKKLPKHFAILNLDVDNALYDKFCVWLNSRDNEYFRLFSTLLVDDNTPVDVIGEDSCISCTGVEIPELTLEEWDEIVNGFTLPEKWCVSAHKDSCVHEWFEGKLKRTIVNSDTSYYHYPDFGYKSCTSGCIKQGYTEITFEQFKKYVLKEVVIDCSKIVEQWQENLNSSPIYSFLDHNIRITSDGIGQSGIDYSGVPGSRASKKVTNGIDFLSGIMEKLDLFPVGKSSEKVYTIEDLSEGRVAVVNDGTRDELNTVLKAAFPNAFISITDLKDLYYYKSDAPYFEFTSFFETNLPTQSVKEFYKQLKPENMEDKRFPFKLEEKDAKRIIKIACRDWRNRLSDRWGVELLREGFVNIEEKYYRYMRKACTDEQHELFDDIFGKDEEQLKVGDWVVRILDVGGPHKLGRVFKISQVGHDSIYEYGGAQHFVSSVRKATPEEIAKAQCPYEDGELCWVKGKEGMGSWSLRYATGKTNIAGIPTFYTNQKKSGEAIAKPYHHSAKGVELPKD
jgi:hypothetical protein